MTWWARWGWAVRGFAVGHGGGYAIAWASNTAGDTHLAILGVACFMIAYLWVATVENPYA